MTSSTTLEPTSTPTDEGQLVAVLDAVLPAGARPRDGALLEPAGPTMASPSWWGADSTRYVLRGATTTFVKVLDPHAHRLVDASASFQAARSAGEAGIGPRVLGADPGPGVIAMELVAGRTGTLDRFASLDAVEQLAQARRRVHRLAPFARTATVFDDLHAALAEAARSGATLPPDVPHLVRRAALVERAVLASGADAVPCHADGNLSNVLVLDDGSVRLVDWDVATNCDPLQDVGALLAELCGPSWSMGRLDGEEVFEVIWGSLDRTSFSRARAFGAVEMLRWAVVASCYDAFSPGTHEYSKFADWQFLRARAALGSPDLDDLLLHI